MIPAARYKVCLFMACWRQTWQDRFELTERNNLLYSGISTYTVDDDGTVRLKT
jgi:phage tail sheath gpL-like